MRRLLTGYVASFNRRHKGADTFFKTDLNLSDVVTLGKQPRRVQARSVLSFWAVHELGMSVTAVGLKLGISESATSRAVQRGRVIAEELALNLNTIRNA